MRTSVT